MYDGGVRAWPAAALWLWGCAQLLSVDEFGGTTSGAGAGGAAVTATSDGQTASTPESSSVSNPGDVGVGTGGSAPTSTGTGGWVAGSKRIFVSAAVLSPNFLASSPDGANALCQKYSNVLNPKGTFKAWIATATAPATCTAGAAYYLVDKATLVGTCTELKGGKNEHAINMTEFGGPPAGTYVWTGAFPSGNATTATCVNWTSNAPSPVIGTIGYNNVVSSTSWSNASNAMGCSNNYPIYCLEQ